MEQLGTGRQFVLGRSQSLLDRLSVELNLVQACPDARLGQAGIGSQVDQPFLLDGQLGELLAQGRFQLDGALLLVGHSDLDHGLYLINELAGQAQRRVFSLDSLLDLGDRQVRQIADAFLSTAAEEVAVQVVVATTRLGVDQPPGAAGFVAALAEQHAFQVVEDDAVALPAGAPSLHDVLHSVEQCLADDCFMPPRQ